MSRRLRPFPLEEFLLAQLPAGFLLAAGWTVMYEVYHEDGSYYTTLMQEILSTEGLFPYFLLSAILMAVPLGLILDAVRHVAADTWLAAAGRACDRPGRHLSLDWLNTNGGDPDAWPRYVLYRHARAAILAPAKAAGNLAVVLLIFLLWFVVKIVRIQGWTVFSMAFIIGTPVVGSALIAMLLARYRLGFREFQRLYAEALAPRVAPAGQELVGPAAPVVAEEDSGAPAFPA